MRRWKQIAGVLLALGLAGSGMSVLAAPVITPQGDVFDPEFYAAAYPDVQAVLGDSQDLWYRHYLEFGLPEGRLPYAYADLDIPAETERQTDPLKPMVALTFDDGPSEYDNQILDALESVNGRATFFMVGKNVLQHQDAVRRMAADGDELGNHSYDHSDLSELSEREARAQILRTNYIVHAVTGTTPTQVRPPYGEADGQVLPALADLGYGAVLWDIDTMDWKYKDADRTVQVVLSRAKDGDIILMHSIQKSTAEAMPQIVQGLTEQGFQLVTISELLAARPERPLFPGTSIGVYIDPDR